MLEFWPDHVFAIDFFIELSILEVCLSQRVKSGDAENYDELIDAPVEIGCHESDGFQVQGLNHYLAFSGSWSGHTLDQLKKDIKDCK